MTARPMVNCILYRVDPETQYVENDTLDSLTVTAYGTDSIICLLYTSDAADD